MRRTTFTLLTIVAPALLAAERPQAPPDAGERPPVRFDRLTNGLRVCVVEERALPLVSVQLWFAAGSDLDPPSHPGLCDAVRARMEPGAGDLAALPPADVRFESRSLRDASYFAWVLQPALLDAVLDQERRRLVAPAGEPAFADASQTEFAQRWFVPGNATLFVMGDVEIDAALDRVRERFGSLPWAEPPRRPERERIDPLRTGTAYEDADARLVTITWPAPPDAARDSAVVDVLMHRLCNPFDGLLHAPLIEAGLGPPSWRRESWSREGRLALSVGVDGAGQVERVLHAVRAALDRAAGAPPDEIAFNRARALAARDVRMRRAAFFDCCRRMAECEMIHGDILLMRRELPRIARLSAGDLRRVAAMLRDAPLATAAAPPPPATITTRAACADPAWPVGVEESRLANGVRVVLLRTAGLELAAVRTVYDPSFGDVRSLLEDAACNPMRLSLIDYLSYHGIGLWHHPDAPTLCGTGPPEFVPQLLELHARLLLDPPSRDGRDAREANAPRAEPSAPEHPATPAPPTIVVVGDVPAEICREALAAAWGAWAGAARDSSGSTRPAPDVATHPAPGAWPVGLDGVDAIADALARRVAMEPRAAAPPSLRLSPASRRG